MTKPAKPYYANPGPAQMRRDGCATALAMTLAGLAGVGMVLIIVRLVMAQLSQQSIF